MDRAEFTAQYIVAEKGLDAMEAAIGPRRLRFSNPGAGMIVAATDAIAQSLAGMICPQEGVNAGAREIARVLFDRDTMADWTADERAALAYDWVTRTDHIVMVD